MDKNDGKYSDCWTVRDEFAAKAMQSFLLAALQKGSHSSLDLVTPAAYEMADAMLKERDNG